MTTTTKRKIKLQPKTRTLTGYSAKITQVPWLNLSGRWLEQAGFNIGSNVEITVRRNKLIIKAL
jgi:toxic protein SymE